MQLYVHVQGNCIQSVEGLKGLQDLQELHISNQRLPEGVGLFFDFGCMSRLAVTLSVLAAIACGLQVSGGHATCTVSPGAMCLFVDSGSKTPVWWSKCQPEG